jgi:hypothetical protein
VKVASSTPAAKDPDDELVSDCMRVSLCYQTEKAEPFLFFSLRD